MIFGGNNDAFLVKFNTNGLRQWGTYFGGSDYDFGYSLCIDVTGNIFLSGQTNSSNNIIIVYDNSVSPPTYGDMVFSIMLARYFTLLDVHVIFYIIEGEYRDDWNCLAKAEEGKIKFVNEQANLAKNLINSPHAEIRRMSWADYIDESSKLSNDSITIFSDKVRHRCQIYHSVWILLNMMISRNEDGILDRFLLTGEELKCYVDIQPIPAVRYIAVGCRYSAKWDLARNISPNEFILINKALRKRFPNYNIMIISCEHGCEYFSNLAKINKIDCIYSKQYSSTYIGDGALILNSDFFFILKGGGISVFPQFSRTPFEAYQHSDSVLWWSHNKWASWQSQRQLFINSGELPRHSFWTNHASIF